MEPGSQTNAFGELVEVQKGQRRAVQAAHIQHEGCWWPEDIHDMLIAQYPCDAALAALSKRESSQNRWLLFCKYMQFDNVPAAAQLLYRWFHMLRGGKHHHMLTKGLAE